MKFFMKVCVKLRAVLFYHIVKPLGHINFVYILLLKPFLSGLFIFVKNKKTAIMTGTYSTRSQVFKILPIYKLLLATI